jgi:hypothetical protein
MRFITTNITKTLTALFTTLLLVAASSLQAQEGFKIGFRVSPALGHASVVNDSTKQVPEGLSTKPNASMGAGVDWEFDWGFVSVTSGVSFQRITFAIPQGDQQRIITDSTRMPIKSEVKKSAVVIPLGLKFRSPEIGTGVYLWGNIGTQANINLSYESTESEVITETDRAGNTTQTVRTFSESGTDKINRVTASFVPAVGMDLGHVQVGMSYHWGLMNILKKDNTSPTPRKRLSYVALNLGYFF